MEFLVNEIARGEDEDVPGSIQVAIEVRMVARELSTVVC
jgi:hypothetical protein